jgi:hypothetical protein
LFSTIFGGRSLLDFYDLFWDRKTPSSSDEKERADELALNGREWSSLTALVPGAIVNTAVSPGAPVGLGTPRETQFALKLEF